MKFGSWTYNGFKVMHARTHEQTHPPKLIYPHLTTIKNSHGGKWRAFQGCPASNLCPFALNVVFLQLNLQAAGEEGDTSTFVLNGEWALLGTHLSTKHHSSVSFYYYHTHTTTSTRTLYILRNCLLTIFGYSESGGKKILHICHAMPVGE